ncbi:MAG: DUF2065 domain-containing protein [Pseudomonadota bacterium]
MEWSLILIGIALFMIFEGMMPFAAPRAWRRAVAQLASMPDSGIRTVGGIIMFLGVVLLVTVTGAR